MQINIISVGKLRSDFSALAGDYIKMTKWRIKNTEITYAKKLPDNQIKQFEAGLILKHLSNNAYKIVLDVLGKHISSEEFAGIFERQMMNGKDIDFIIGGAFGLDDEVLKIADFKMSLSKMTMPHQLAKIILLEQVYRSQTIIEKHPYHK
jgi:23S rRNA (pseudouridine1915-N3)-methyltransferase